MQKIVIVGAGWLGSDLVGILSAKDFEVHASFRNEQNRNDIQHKGGLPFFLDLNGELDVLNEVLDHTHTLIVSIPPGKVQNYGTVVKQIVSLAEENRVGQLIFTSSTSVYPDVSIVTEDLNLYTGNHLSELLSAEKSISESGLPQKFVLRLAGLIGEGRHPGRFLAGKTNLPAPHAPVNLVHKEDVIQIIEYCINDDLEPGIYNICSDEHPSRKEYYTLMAKRADLVQPAFTEDKQKGKLISGDKLYRQVKHSFKSIWEV